MNEKLYLCFEQQAFKLLRDADCHSGNDPKRPFDDLFLLVGSVRLLRCDPDSDQIVAHARKGLRRVLSKRRKQRNDRQPYRVRNV